MPDDGNGGGNGSGAGNSGDGDSGGSEVAPDPDVPATEPEFVEHGRDGGSETADSGGDGD